MFHTILIANRGDQRLVRAAAKLDCLTRAACAGGLAEETIHV
jgi:hypothetical protein